MFSASSKADQLYQTIRKGMMQNHGTSNPMNSPIVKLTKWVRDYKVGIHSFFVTVNFVAWMVILFGAFSGRLVWAEDFYDVDPSVVGEIIINSELVICKSNVCSYYDEPLKVLEHDQVFPDGYIIVYPEGKATPKERLAARKHVQEYWFQYMRSN